MASDDTTTVLTDLDATAVRFMVEHLDDQGVLKVFELSGGEGPVADLAAEQMERRNLDY
ncbi:hypothetical protein [Sphingomonas lacusdianchii]|uniref:hypothetical protein n=1 Tax=Sphingomonas lacusdianchii TaxID=2917992 RepID=UPI001F56EF70|nr:hypothetical protein [Sphingomonas sp. JXJ CY 53]